MWAAKAEQLVFMMPSVKKIFDLMDDDVVEAFAENEIILHKIGCYDWEDLQISKQGLSKNRLMMRKNHILLWQEWKNNQRKQ